MAFFKVLDTLYILGYMVDVSVSKSMTSTDLGVWDFFCSADCSEKSSVDFPGKSGKSGSR